MTGCRSHRDAGNFESNHQPSRRFVREFEPVGRAIKTFEPRFGVSQAQALAQRGVYALLRLQTGAIVLYLDAQSSVSWSGDDLNAAGAAFLRNSVPHGIFN